MLQGRAPAGSTMALVRGDELLGTGLTNDQDCWTIHVLPDLEPGRHDMELVAHTPDGQTLRQDYSLTIDG